MVFVTTDPARDDETALRTLPRPVRPGVRRAHRRPATTIIDVGKPLAVAVEQGEKLPSGGYEVTHGTQVTAIDARRPGPDPVDPGHLRRPTSPTTSTSCSPDGMTPDGQLTHADRRCPSPAPSQGVWDLGPVPIRGYALCIIAGIVAAIWIGERRWVARGGKAGRDQRPRRLGGAVRPRRRPALPRDHRLRPLLRRGPQRVGGALRLARRPRHLGRDRAGRRSASCIGARLKGIRMLPVHGRDGARRAGRPGDRPLGQLVQPGAVRQADRPAVGPGDRRRRTGRRGLRRPVRDVPPDVPLRVPVGARRRRRS